MRDVIVIGAGGGGLVVAKELAARGLDVLLLEAGRRNADPETEWTHFEHDANNPITGFLRFGPEDRSKPDWFRELPQNALIWQVAGVGGTTTHYFGNSPRAMPGVFQGYRGRDKKIYDRAHRFPFTYEALRPYYQWVEATLPVQTAAMGTNEEVFFQGAQAIGLPVQTTTDIIGDAFRPQENAILQPGGNAGLSADASELIFPKATGCTFCGYCLEGCYEPIKAPRNLKAKRSTDNSYAPMALTADLWSPGGKAVSLISNAFATRIHTDEETGIKRTVRGVSWRDTVSGETFTEEAKVVVMAAGCVEDPRLWFNSGLPNPNGWVGRGFTDHAVDWVVGVFPFYTGMSRGPGSGARADFPGRGSIQNTTLPPGVNAFGLSFSDSGVRGGYDNGLGTTGNWDGPSGRALGNEIKEVMANLDNLMNLLILTDDDVEPQYHEQLSTLFFDEHGAVPKLIMPKRTRSARTLANREFLANKAADILRVAGATKVLRIDWPPLLMHVHSSMRMGISSKDSVLDANAEARWVRRLFVADNAALANALGGPNPTLTTQALATRTAEKIFRLYFDGDPWVGKESPISSIDDVITRAVMQSGL